MEIPYAQQQEYWRSYGNRNIVEEGRQIRLRVLGGTKETDVELLDINDCDVSKLKPYLEKKLIARFNQKMLESIDKEWKKQPFQDWFDFQERVTGVGPKIVPHHGLSFQRHLLKRSGTLLPKLPDSHQLFLE